MYPEFGIKRESFNELIISQINMKESKVGSTFHFHSLVEIMQVKRGKIEALVGERREVLSEGEIAIALSYEPHSFHGVVDSLADFLFIPTFLCEDFIKMTQNKRVSAPFIRDKKTAEKISRAISELHRKEINKIEIKGYIYVILGAIFEKLEFDSGAENIDTSLNSKLLSYINENYKSNINLQRIAVALGYNPSYISKHFRSCFGISINRYITTVRLKNAVMLIHSREGSVTDAALESGFPSLRTFYRAFEAEFKCSPREYLKREC